jgi:hypothetical protein
VEEDPEGPTSRAVLVCLAGGAHWHEGEDPRCGDEAHDHQRFDVHRHRFALALPDGTVVRAASYDAVDPYGRPQPPDHGLYLDERWAPPWPHAHVDWPDFGLPADPAPFAAALRDVHRRAQAGERVEVGCLGGHGRTGTALACLAVLAGLPADEAVAWVRANYCPQAVETEEQEAFVRGFRP